MAQKVTVSALILFLLLVPLYGTNGKIVSSLQPIWQSTVVIQTYCEQCQEYHNRGTGFVLQYDGFSQPADPNNGIAGNLVITCAHVIRLYTSTYYDVNDIRVASDVSASAGVKIDRYRYDEAVDVAVLWLKEPLPALASNSWSWRQSLPIIGQKVYTIGFPVGLGKSVSAGIVSSLHQHCGDEPKIQDYILIDAAANPGNSGSPVVDAAGRVCGMINSGIGFQGYNTGLNFAIPEKIIKLAIRKFLLEDKLDNFWQKHGF